MIFFFKDICETVQAGFVTFGMQVDDDVMHCRIEAQTSLLYFFLCLSDFPSFHTLNNELFS